MATYFISDLHLGHKNIILYESRPFKDTNEMDEKIVENWNYIVNQEDKIFILGDLTFYPKEKSKEIVSQLNGRKILIIGSHDYKANSWFHDIGVNEIYKYPVIYKNFYILSHEPVYLNDHMPFVNIHGHLHSKKYMGRQHINVSVECINYAPISFDSIKALIGVEIQ